MANEYMARGLMIAMLWACCQRVRAAHWRSQALLRCI